MSPDNILNYRINISEEKGHAGYYDESGTFRKVRGGKLHHSIRVGGSGIKISRSQTHTFRSYQGIYLTGIITPGALRRETPPPSNQNQ